MARKLPSDAFDVYVSLGTERSYQTIADRYNVSKTAVTKRAVKERWRERLAEIESTARDDARRRLADEIAATNERHLKVLRVLEAKAVEALRDMPLDSPAAVVRAIEVAVGKQRELLGLAPGRGDGPKAQATVNIIRVTAENRDEITRLARAQLVADGHTFGAPVSEARSSSRPLVIDVVSEEDEPESRLPSILNWPSDSGVRPR